MSIWAESSARLHPVNASALRPAHPHCFRWARALPAFIPENVRQMYAHQVVGNRRQHKGYPYLYLHQNALTQRNCFRRKISDIHGWLGLRKQNFQVILKARQKEKYTFCFALLYNILSITTSNIREDYHLKVWIQGINLLCETSDFQPCH